MNANYRDVELWNFVVTLQKKMKCRSRGEPRAENKDELTLYLSSLVSVMRMSSPISFLAAWNVSAITRNDSTALTETHNYISANKQ